MSLNILAVVPPLKHRPGVSLLIARLEALRRHLFEAEARVPLDGFDASAESARNLLHYIALRELDLRTVQTQLADLGLSSLGRSEAHVLYNLDAVLTWLHFASEAPPRLEPATRAITPERGRSLIARNARRLFGPPRVGRTTRIMVTMPTEAADDPRFVRRLLESGMDCMRINCAHDSSEAWRRMIEHLHRAERAVGRKCPVLMDLGGPRLRTGPIRPGPAVLRVRPVRDAFGRVTRRGRLRLLPAGGPEDRAPSNEPVVLVPKAWLARRWSRESLRITDARGSRRTLRIDVRGPKGAIVSLDRTTYFSNGLVIEAREPSGRPDRAVISGVPATAGRIRLASGDSLLLTPSLEQGHDRGNGPGDAHSPATIGVSLPEVLARLHRGHRVWFDGGRIGGVVRGRSRRGVLLRVDHAPPEGTWLKADQGINLPDTPLRLPPLTPEDERDLPFIAGHADLVGYSFVQSASDVALLRSRLVRLGRPRIGIVLKIETRRAFDELPAILLSALRSGPTGVMLARGDLAVEVGFERLAEVQEEILWLCEAAHLPAIWATQVLEGLAQSGSPSRAEVTDAAMGERAECVMLNKGPYLVAAVRALDSIVRRMQAHQAKKSARLRHLAVAERFLHEVGSGGTPKTAHA